MNSTLAYFTARAAQLPSDEDIRLERLTASGGDRFAVAFSASSVQDLIWTVPQIPTSYQGGDLFIDLHCAMATATSGTVGISAAVEAASSIEIDETSFDTANASSTSVPGTAGETFTVTIALTNDDSLSVGDAVRVKIARVLAGATATGALYVLGGVFYESIDTVTLDGDLVAGAISASQIVLADGSALQLLADGSIVAGGTPGDAGHVLTSNGNGVNVTWEALPQPAPATTNILIGDGSGGIADGTYSLPLDFADLTGTGTVAEISGVAAGDLLMSADGATGITSTGFLAPDQDLRTDQAVTFSTVEATGVDSIFAGLVVTGSQSIVGTLFVDTLSISVAGGGSPTYTFPTIDGTDGQVLTTDGVGAVVWADPPAINPFDQDLNTGDSPNFVAIRINTLYDLNNTLGGDGQVLTSDGASCVWADAANPFDQDLNVGDSPTFAEITSAGNINGVDCYLDASIFLGGNIFDLTASAGEAGQVLTALGGATGCTWQDPPNFLDQLVWNEIPSGTIDGSNNEFSLTGVPVTGKLLLFKNGVLQLEGSGNDYALVSSTITFESGAIPQSGDILLATYQT